MRLTSHAAHGAKWTSLSTAITTAADMAKTVVLARLLSPIDFGLMAVVSIVFGVAQTYADLGISAALIHRQNATKQELSSLYWLNIFMGCATFAVLWICTPLLTIAFHDARLSALLRTTIIIFLFTPFGAQFQILLQKELDFKLLAWQEIMGSVAGLAVGVVCAVRGMGTWALVYSFLAGGAVRTLLLLSAGLPRFCPTLHFRWSDLRSYTSFGLFQLGERTLIYVTDRTDQILIGTVLGTSALGYYNFAFNLTARPIGSINPVLTRVAFPLFAKVQHDTDRLRNGYLRLLRFLTMVNAPLLVGLAVVAPVAVPTIFGAKWVVTVVPIQILCIVSLLRSTINPIGSLQLAKGRADMGFWWNVACFAISAPVIYIAGKMGGLVGIVEGLLLLQIVQSLLLYRYMVVPLVGRCGAEYTKAQLTPIFLAGLMGAVIAFASNDLLPRAVELGVNIGLGACVYVTLMAMFYKKGIQEFKTLVTAS
jgi:lipopolysaccharide exporter